jgi:hypothetical protein
MLVRSVHMLLPRGDAIRALRRGMTADLANQSLTTLPLRPPFESFRAQIQPTPSIRPAAQGRSVVRRDVALAAEDRCTSLWARRADHNPPSLVCSSIQDIESVLDQARGWVSQLAQNAEH